MSGLDTRGAFDGFVKGFGMMQSHRDSQDRKKYMQQQQDMQQRGLEMREQEFSARQDDRQRQQDQQYITQFYALAEPLMMDTDNPESMSKLTQLYEDEEAKAVFERNPMASMSHILNPKTIAAVETAEKLAQGEGELFSESTAAAMNDYFSPVVNRIPGRRTSIMGVYPGQKEGTMAFDLGVTPIGDDGTEGEAYTAAMTVGRGTAEDGDDEVMQVPIGDIIDKVHGARTIYQALGPERIAQFQRSLRTMGYLPPEAPQYQDVEGPDGSLFQVDQHGKKTQLLGRRPQTGGAGGSAYGNPTSQQKNFLFLRDALELSDEDAYKVAFGGTGAVNDRVSDRVMKGISLLNTQIKEIDSTINTQGMMLEEEELAQLTAQREELAQQRDMLASQANLFGDAQGMPQLGQPQQSAEQQPQAQPQQLQPGHVEDGYEFLGGDPSDPANWRQL